MFIFLCDIWNKWKSWTKSIFSISWLCAKMKRLFWSVVQWLWKLSEININCLFAYKQFQFQLTIHNILLRLFYSVKLKQRKSNVFKIVYIFIFQYLASITLVTGSWNNRLRLSYSLIQQRVSQYENKMWR